MEITEIAGYRVLRQLGAGGMGQVYLVEHPRLPRRDALKLLDAGVSRNDDFQARFQREADLLAQLSHPNIVTLHDRGEHQGRLWITMEYVEGIDADHLLSSRGPMPFPLAHSLISGAGAALDYAWRKHRITHRDVKPANILLALDDSTALNDASSEFTVEAVKLADFGIAKAAEEATSLTSTGITIGTLAYISPEAIEGDRVDNRSDIYSLGCTAFHLLTGQPPFTAGSVTALMSAHLHLQPPPVTDLAPHVPVAVDSVLARVLAKNPDQRYQSCADFVAALSDAMSGRFIAAAHEPYSVTATAPTPAAAPIAADTGASSLRGRRWPTILAAAAAVAVLAAGGTAAYLFGQDDRPAAPAAAPSSITSTTVDRPTTTRTTTTTPTVTETLAVPTVPTTVAAVPAEPEPLEGQPCGPDEFNDYSADGTLYCSAMNGAWTDRTHQSRAAVEGGSSCSEPGARARISQTDAIATCKYGPDGTLGWNL
ncbi:serine/threonine-protein kinase [Gordonia sp. (in: high G+C Gram-positive bacteria)]|uniref:serine/threonine-protein kinase n=1 Tax=Gordonia sp. (in: high G+C Gram-positive bacteria) TaxID=84139 RepID=UPI0016AC0757|nr:serine/threonine-protein kinase [Gordonia sp. (in: high G+C Gram-positive bacteria)]NLG47268.1 serine/threonine protein kinase [Gordonia sp. (in: high G+C Gram-positive bacteria)]